MQDYQSMGDIQSKLKRLFAGKAVQVLKEALKNIKEAIELCIGDAENPVGSIIVGNVVFVR